MDSTEKKKSRDFNIYYLNFSKVYEIAMMINNVILTKIETDKSSSFEEQYGLSLIHIYSHTGKDVLFFCPIKKAPANCRSKTTEFICKFEMHPIT